MMDEKIDLGFDYFDKCETHHNCTVQILTNTKTGKTSIGWIKDTYTNPFQLLKNYCELHKNCANCGYRGICEECLGSNVPAKWEVEE